MGQCKILARAAGLIICSVVGLDSAFAQAPGESAPTEVAPAVPQLPATPAEKFGPENPLGAGSPQVPLTGNELKRGWSRYLSLGLTGTENDSKKVLGRDDGETTSWGAKVLGSVSLRGDESDWRNNLSFIYATARNPYIPEYVKSDDALSLISLYIYHLPGATWFGPFGRAAVKTVTSQGEDVRAVPHQYIIQKRDGTTTTEIGARHKLNDPWKPTILKETVGGYFELYGTKMASVEFLAGFGARQTYAKNQMIPNFNPYTETILLTQLNDSKHVGPEAILQFHGLLVNDLISYSLVSDALFPTHSSGGTGVSRSAYDGRIVETDGSISLKLTNWLALDYTLGMLRDLDLADETQLSNTVQFSINLVISQ